MIEASRRWFRRHRNKFAVGIGIVGVGYLTGQYIVNKIAEARERMSIDRISKENLRRRFQQNQEDCTFTVLALLPTVTENILDALPTESITQELQQQKAERLGRSVATSEIAPSEISSSEQPSQSGDAQSQTTESFIHTSQLGDSSLGEGRLPPKPRKSKAQLWSDLKISSITRTFTLIYILSLLTLLTRIQLNLLGRLNYLSSVITLAVPPPSSTISLENNDDDREQQSYGHDFETNRRYLTFSWWLLHRGWRDIKDRIEEAVKELFGPLNPREDLTFEKLSSLVIEVRKKVEGATEEDRRNRKWLPYLLPPRDQEALVLQESGMMPSPQTTPSSDSVPPTGTPTTTGPVLTSPTDPLRRLLDETSDLIDSPTSTHITTLLLDALFSQLTDHALREQAFKSTTPSSDPSPRVQEILSESAEDDDPALRPPDNQVKAKLATILAVITRQAHPIGSGVPNEYQAAIEGVRELEAFAAVIFSSHSEVNESVMQGESAPEGPGPGSGSTREGAGAEEELSGTGSTWGLWDSIWGKASGAAG